MFVMNNSLSLYDDDGRGGGGGGGEKKYGMFNNDGINNSHCSFFPVHIPGTFCH